MVAGSNLPAAEKMLRNPCAEKEKILKSGSPSGVSNKQRKLLACFLLVIGNPEDINDFEEKA